MAIEILKNIQIEEEEKATEEKCKSIRVWYGQSFCSLLWLSVVLSYVGSVDTNGHKKKLT